MSTNDNESQANARENLTLRVLEIVRGTTVDGPGLRTSIYFAGCRHKCPGCHNPHSWDFSGGNAMTLDEIMDVVKEEQFGVTLTGGDPLYHPREIAILIDMIHTEALDVWLYTGFTKEEIIADSDLLKVARKADAIVEGRFIASLRDETLRFRGSTNQRILFPPEDFISL